jgi:beta-glucanase (GH16 family)
MRKSYLPRTTRGVFYIFLFVVPLIFSSCQAAQANQPSASQPLVGTPGKLQPTATATPIPRSTTTSTPLGQTGKWKLIFHDEFNGSTLDSSKWNTCYFNFVVGNGCDHDQGEQELYQPDEVSVNHGILDLQAEKQTVTAVNGKTYHYTSGMVSTGPGPYSSYSKFTFKYGYVEMLAKLPSGDGLWPAFWLLPANLNWPPEIDIFEYLGKSPTSLFTYYHYSTATNSDKHVGGPQGGSDFSANWHTYAMQWAPGSITWYIDGVERYRYTNANTVASQPMYLIANLAVGGSWPGSTTASTPFPSTFQINYIRVWQK